ncbi:MAG: DUF294 nucleotidyltransferase-like domain-containing protein [Pseudomonadota bacterium]
MTAKYKSLKGFFFKIIFPTLLAIVLFVSSIFYIIIPKYEDMIMRKKQEMIMQLTNSAVSILNKYSNENKLGNLELKKAQQMAILEIEALRYGDENKDYFWINDLIPKMIMHPYRKDLNGKDLSSFEDKAGKKFFVEFVNATKEKGQAYVNYMWQWKDDANKIVPKLSYVKRFNDWNWIVGTGIYIEDVKLEISSLTKSLVNISGLICLSLALFLLFIMKQSFSIESKKLEAEIKLKESKEKYKALASVSSEGTMILLDGKNLYPNQTLLELLDYSRSEFNLLTIDDIIVTEYEDSKIWRKNLDAFLKGNSNKELFNDYEVILKKKDFAEVPVILNTSKIVFHGKNTIVMNFKDLSLNKQVEQRKIDRQRDEILSQLQTELLYLNKPVKDFFEDFIEIASSASIKETAELMKKMDKSSILIKDKEENYIGIVTDKDFRNKIFSQSLNLNSSIAGLASTPLISISDRALSFEASIKMQENNIGHIVVKSDSNEILSVLENKELLKLKSYSPTILLQEIKKAKTVAEIVDYHKQLPMLVKTLIESGAMSKNITRIITTISDSITVKLIKFAIAELGNAPCDFAFIALGSEGRQEQTLVTDQDNAFIYDDSTENPEAYQNYFLKLGELVCTNLDKAGYSFCTGEIMAKNLNWCQPISVWKEYFSKWIENSDPKDLLQLSIFFDFRCIYGNDEFIEEIKNTISDKLKANNTFFRNLATNAMLSKPPLNIFGKISAEKSEDNEEIFNIKKAIRPLIEYARIYALQNNIFQTNTINRLEKLFEKGALNKTDYQEAMQVYNYLMQVRFAKQARKMNEGEKPNNNIHLSRLTHMERVMLQNSFSQISNFQSKLDFDFLKA